MYYETKHLTANVRTSTTMVNPTRWKKLLMVPTQRSLCWIFWGLTRRHPSYTANRQQHGMLSTQLIVACPISSRSRGR